MRRERKKEREKEYPPVLSLWESHKSHTIRHVNKSIPFGDTKFIRKNLSFDVICADVEIEFFIFDKNWPDRSHSSTNCYGVQSNESEKNLCQWKTSGHKLLEK